MKSLAPSAKLGRLGKSDLTLDPSGDRWMNLAEKYTTTFTMFATFANLI